MLNKEGNAYKRGQIYADETGKNWVYWGTVREYYENPKSVYGRVSKASTEKGRFYEIGHAPKGYYAPDHKTKGADLKYEKLTFIANSVKDYELLLSGVDTKLINLINGAIKEIKKLPKNQSDEWTYDAIVYWMRSLRRFVECLNNLEAGKENVCNGHHQLNSILEKRLRNWEITVQIETPIKEANEQTIAELKKLAKIIEKERIAVLNNFDVKRKFIEGYIEKYYDDPNKEFLNSLVSYDIMRSIDFVNDGFDISDVKVEVKIKESCSGNIQYWSYSNVGSATINGKEYKGDFYSKQSHGWNYNN